MSILTIFITLNIVFGILCLLGLGFNVINTLTIIAQGPPATDPSQSEAYQQGYLTGQLGGMLIPPILSLSFAVMYFITAIALYKRTVLGYYLHLFMAVCTAFSCCACPLGVGGIVYTIPALIFSFNPSFRTEFPELNK